MRIGKLLIMLFITAFLIACGDTEDVKIKVTGYPGTTTNSGDFVGSYELDDGTSAGFNGTIVTSTDSTVYEYEKVINEEFKKLRVYVVRKKYDSQLVVKIYRSGAVTEETSLDADTADYGTNYVELEYEYTTEDSTTTTTDDDDSSS
ncbi:MAG: hypothetical protein GY754_26360 [bacterium]|nr:hypothetical protein [bacterium]